jgi:tRNA U34 5-carboxymethylaminomethyl modifying GTPase MnmE/TrmE
MKMILNEQTEKMEEVLNEFFEYFKFQCKIKRNLYELDEIDKITEQFQQLSKAFSSYCIGVNLLNNLPK